MENLETDTTNSYIDKDKLSLMKIKLKIFFRLFLYIDKHLTHKFGNKSGQKNSQQLIIDSINSYKKDVIDNYAAQSVHDFFIKLSNSKNDSDSNEAFNNFISYFSPGSEADAAVGH
tara:strand:+ start:2647 stop:2994 length:348 start_codon:yes stop_codon:yes gene_type:complete